MTCSACGTENEAGRKFCKACGAPLALLCPSCSSPNTPDSRFCGECGNVLEGPVVTPGPEAPPTERRLVSVLFTDLVGFTTLSEHRDAEDVRELLGRYFDLARETIERHGGLVEKFIGDAVMAVWGTPVAHEDDAERAVRTGLELVDAVEGLGRSVGVDLRARGGVLTGEAAATIGAVSQGIVVGDMVNTASRLQSAAEPGAVLVGEATFRAASRAIAFEEVGELTLKGKDQPTKAWRALRVVSERGGARRATGLEPPFVGRAEELRMIKEQLHATGREGKARLVSVLGIGGIGKSRLAWEFAKYTDGLSENVYWHQGRCPAYGDGVTFWALGEMVRMRARIAEGEPAAEARSKLSAAIHEHVADDEEQRWIEPRLAHLLGLDERPPGEREELFSAWRTFFERVADRGTTAMVFEDLQWADAGLLDFIESMLEWSRAHPILIMTLSRPELAEKRPNWGSGQRNFTSVHLEPLPDEAMADIVDGFVHGLPPEGTNRIVERAEGVPLYAVETVRMLADRGVLEAREDAYELVGDLGNLEIPETLHALIAARLDTLAPEDRALLQDAAVLGKSFTIEGLAAVTGSDHDALEPRLRDLVRKEFLTQDSDPRSPERGQYGFLQALIREVAHGTLSKTGRRRSHLAAAHHFESLTDDELAGLVAAHYVEAFRATPAGPDADALAARARDWLGQAAERATSLGSPEQALVFAEQALEITPDGPERAALLDQAAEAATSSARPEPAVAYLEEAFALYERAGDVSAAARCTARLARPLSDLDRHHEAIEKMEKALDALGEDGDEQARAGLFAALARAARVIGANDRCIDFVERALILLERLDLPEQLEEAITTKASWMMNVGRHREGVMLFEGALNLAEQIGNLKAQAGALLMLGIVILEDDPRGALGRDLEGARVARRAGARPDELSGLGNAAEAALDLGEWATADEIIADLGSRSDLPILARRGVAVVSALLAGYRGEFDDANAQLSQEALGMEETSFVMSRTWYLRTRSLVSLMQGDLSGAYEEGMKAVEAEPSGANTPLSLWSAARAALWARDIEKARVARAAMDLLHGRWIENCRRTIGAGIAALEGHIDDAATGYARALQAWLEMELPLDHAYCAIDAATLLPEEAVPQEAVAEARTYLEQLGAKPLLERLSASVPSGAPTR